ncbi:MAG TPA: HPr(Ser) kinase/phosphatase [Pyrinomonadaceae bacterium]|jgi:HPr kinase/phosphorylase|nr:HPr(Ser) kinase/phosphatase [Pyrinomonadaceae bacterium]
MQTTPHNAVESPTITVGAFVKGAPSGLALSFLAGARGAESRVLRTPRIQKLGLALAGFPHYVHEGRVQIVGHSELQFLGQLSPAERREAFARLELEKISCVLVTKGLAPPAELVEAAERAALPLIQTPLVSSVAITAVTEYLEEALAPRELRHGVLLDLYGLGVLIEGKSGVGKSECALDLILRGHQLVADDLVEVRRTRPGQLTGSTPDLLREHMEIRGLGIVNVRELFGASSVSGPTQIDLGIVLQRWEEATEVDRLGLDARTVDILGVAVPHFVLPVSPGRNLATLVETAVRVHLMRLRGYNAAQKLVARHGEMLGGRKAPREGASDAEDDGAADD